MSGTFDAPFWLRNAHLQTVWPLLRQGPLPAYRRQRWDTPDGDFLDLDWIDGNPAQPLVVLFHGLEGSSRSHYARQMMQAVARCHWRGVVVHFRGCSGEPNRLPRAYHSGDAAELNWVLRRLAAPGATDPHGQAPLFAVGVSLGGNALLKWLAETGAEAGTVLRAAAAVSAPLDLAAANAELSRWPKRLYARHFLRTLIPKTVAKAQHFPGLVDLARVTRARTLRDFDDAVTAPLHGFHDADDYYARSSSGPLLSAIATPTLLVHAADDPFLPAQALPRRFPAAITPLISPCGGHAGFVHGMPPGRIDWLPQRLLHWFGQHS
ncbi:MAG: hydrolase [Betaproteobacteria bacterium HGW-Betaproteobacteria-11]|nr:MAG: hydrolase [Betaproteobacteria bacterium HGW-Betaproteobacteria-11]